METVVTYKSGKGRTKHQHLIFDGELSIKSYAALVLLNEKLKLVDEDYLESLSETQKYLTQRFKYLNNIFKN